MGYQPRITAIDRDIWNYLWARFEEGRGSPSVAEMARACYCSTAKVLATMTKLEAKGYVTWAWLNDERRAARGCLTVVAPDDELARIDRERQAELTLTVEQRRATDRERALLRMRRARAKKNGSMTDIF